MLAMATGQSTPQEPAGAGPVVVSPPTIQLRKDLPASVPTDSPIAPVLSLLKDINEQVPLSDVVLFAPNLPFGFMVDVPVDISRLNGQPVQNPALRAAVWKLLASLSFQLDLGWLSTAAVPQDTEWAQAIRLGSEGFREVYGRSFRTFNGQCDEIGNPQMGFGELHCIFAHENVGYLVIQLLRAMEQVRLNNRARMTAPEINAMEGL
jgi:hypothetical protein